MTLNLIIQICMPPHFGVICERLLTADKASSLIQSNFTRPRLRCKDYERFPLAAPKPLFHIRPQFPGAGGISLRRCRAADSPRNVTRP